MKLIRANWNPTEKQVLYILIAVILITTVADMYTAFSSPIFEIGETNPIYVLTNSIFPLLAMTVGVTMWIIININKRISLIKIFLFSMLAIYLSLGHGFGVWSNITATESYYQNPTKFIESIEGVTVKEKVTAYSWLVGLVMLMPLIVSTIAFQVALFFYNKRKPKREKIIDDIVKSAGKLYRG